MYLYMSQGSTICLAITFKLFFYLNRLVNYMAERDD